MNPEVLSALAQAINVASGKLGGREALAKFLGCSTEALRRWAKGEREPGLGISVAIFKAADTPLPGGSTELEGRLRRLEQVLLPAGSDACPQSRIDFEDAYRGLLEGLAALDRANEFGLDLNADNSSKVIKA